ncbi:Uncharacterized protein dnm_080360 [Desulfonema magnum]|uniref:Uncharacterized protein n=1 Tax=Desulfonema magnum TaxID=45655 RepID=A0A975GTB5_9BACT|nr:Uncharacterized protein dnm_080360 [Desulfonema magnum]
MKHDNGCIVYEGKERSLLLREMKGIETKHDGPAAFLHDVPCSFGR